MKKSAIAPILMAIICPLSLSLTACSPPTDCGSESYGIFGGVSTLCDSPEERYYGERFEHYDLPVTPSYVGEDFADYEDLQPKEYELSTHLYKLLAQLPYYERAYIPLYRMEVDKKRMTRTAAELAKKYSLEQEINEDNHKLYVYKGDSKSVIADSERGKLTYVDAALRDDHAGVADVDKRAFLESAQRYFEQFLSHQDMESSYYYTYSTKVEKDLDSDADVVTRVTVGINRVVNGIPLLGDAGKSSIEFNAAGDIVKMELSYEKYIDAESERPTINIDRVEQSLFNKMREDKVSLTDHYIARAEFGYGKVKEYGADLGPVFRYVIEPQEGVTDASHTYEIIGFESRREYDEAVYRDKGIGKVSE